MFKEWCYMMLCPCFDVSDFFDGNYEKQWLCICDKHEMSVILTSESLAFSVKGGGGTE